MSRGLSMAALAALLAASPTPAQLSLEGAVVIGSDSPWRGLSLNDRSPTWSTNVYSRHPTGAYLGLVMTAVEFRGAPGADPQLELQADLGVRRQLGRGLALEVGVLDSHYPSASGPLDFEEPYFRLSRGRGTVGLNYAPNYFGGESRSFHTWGSYAVPLDSKVSVDLQAADFRFSNEPGAGLKDYWYWVTGLRAELDGVTVQLLYTDTRPNSVGFRRSSWTFLMSTRF